MQSRALLAAACGLCLLAVPAFAAEPAKPVAAQPAPAAPAPKYTTAGTELGTLLDDPAAKEIVEKHIPGMTTNPQVEMARAMTLKDIQIYNAEEITDERLAAIDADLAKLPPK